ncbi:MAG: hypothetical protein ABIJ05_02325 [Patescibacteria group bacterium]
MSKLQKIILALIIVVAFILRFYALSQVPPGLHADEASQGFNAFSILTTGKDMYGKSFPVLFRASGSYQPPIYTYLAIIPTMIWGNSVFTIKSVSAICGVGLAVLTFFLIKKFAQNKKEATTLGLIAAGIITISPWAIHFSRLAVEANLGVLIFVSGVFLLTASLKKINLFPVACLVLGLSTHAYYSERVIAVLLLGAVLIIFRKYFLKFKKETFWGLGIFVLTLIPHLFILTTGALTKRLTQVSYFGSDAFAQSSFIDNVLEVVKQFINHYLIYLSPKNLFFDPGSALGRTTPDLGVFYPWMIVPFLIGLGYLFKNRENIFLKIIGLILIIAPIPAGLTGDLFYPLRTLDYLWAISIVVALGSFEIWKAFKNNWLKSLITLIIIIYSLTAFGISYFVIFKYEGANGAGGPYIKLIPYLEKYPDKDILVDFSSRAWGVGIRMTYLMRVDPKIVQKNLKSQLTTKYYSPYVNAQEIFKIDNVVFKILDWREVCGPNLIVVGDQLSFSPKQIMEHKLYEEFIVPDYLGSPVLYGYSTKTLCK